MGARGPRKKPTALRVVKGERKDRINTSEPKPGKPATCPQWLSTEGRKLWRRIAPQLERRGGLSDWDREALAVYCEEVIDYIEATKAVRRGGVLVKGYRGALVKNPALQIKRDAAVLIRSFAQEFGLTPSSRSDIRLEDKAQPGGPERLLS